MQNKIVLDPSYRGPIIIEEYLRKMKSQSSLGRMISTYNKRFFTLDFKRMIFYYLPEKGSQLSNAQDIPLDSITRIYLDKQLQLLDDGQIWKHGFVILCGKRSYKLISHSQNNMENLLYAFAHLINNETKKPLFDWAEYKANNQAPIHDQVPQIFSPAVPGIERKESSETTALNQAGPVPKKKSSHDRRSDDETEKPNAFIRGNQETSEHKGRQEIPEGPRTEEPALEIKREKSKPNNENVKQGAETKKKMSGERREEDQTVQQNNAPPKKLNIREVDSVDVCESQIIMPNESVHANINANSSEEEQPVRNYAPAVEEKGVEPLKNKMEVLNIDPSESTPTHGGPLSGKGKLNLNRRLMNQDSPKGNGWGQSPKSEFSGQLKAKTYKSSEDRFEVNRETSDANSLKVQQQISQDQDDGWGQVRKENVYKVEKKVQEVDEWDVESPPKKKNVVSKVQDDDDWDKDVNYSPPQKKSVPNHVGKMQTNTVKKADDDDDWDKDMSDDDSKPQNNRFEIRTDAKYTSQTSGYSSSAGAFGRPTKTIEVPVAKGNVHNDWDDDL